MLTSPLPSVAQERAPLIGILLNGVTVAPSDLDIVRELARMGYIERRNIAYAIRGAAGDLSRLPQLARELVALKPNVVVGAATPAADALFGATKSIPIVMTVIGDPMALGLTDSMSRPTHNVTGFTVSSLSLASKRLELLHEIVPTRRTVGYLWMPENRLATLFESHVRKAAEILGIKLVSLPLTPEADIASVFVRADEEAVTAVIVETNPLTLRASGAIVVECLVRDLPGIHSWPIEVRNGALVSYGPAAIENSVGTANYIVRILKGTKIIELPFEEPTEIKLAVNLRTARSIGVVFPPSLLARADEVIE